MITVLAIVACVCAIVALVCTHRALGAVRSLRDALNRERGRCDAWKECALSLVDADDRPALLGYLCTLPAPPTSS